VNEHHRVAGAPGTVLPEKGATLVRQYHVARLAGLGPADHQGAGIRVEVGYLKPA
jgi:hypothetical protein